MRCVEAILRGDAPRCSTNKRRNWREPKPSLAASCSTPPPFSAPSKIKRKARETTAEVPSHAGVPGAACGWQRLQGRKPAVSAAAAHANRTICFGRAKGTGQTFRQYRPVVLAPAKNLPSKRRSRLARACQQMSGSSKALRVYENIHKEVIKIATKFGCHSTESHHVRKLLAERASRVKLETIFHASVRQS